MTPLAPNSCDYDRISEVDLFYVRQIFVIFEAAIINVIQFVCLKNFILLKMKSVPLTSLGPVTHGYGWTIWASGQVELFGPQVGLKIFNILFEIGECE